MTAKRIVPPPCVEHPCDQCPRCRSGHCCRTDNPTYQLPVEGDWDGPIYGELGVLRRDEETVTCHCCGKDFKALGQHALAAHDLTPAEYRAIFGLNRRLGLASLGLHATLAESGRASATANMQAGFDFNQYRLTPEQMSQVRRGQRQRRQTRITHNAVHGSPREDRRCPICRRTYTVTVMSRRRSCGAPACKQALKQQRGKENVRHATEGSKQLWADPDRRAAMLAARRPANEARRRPVTLPCGVCGTPFTTTPSNALRVRNCGALACREETRRRGVALLAAALRRPAVLVCAICGAHVATNVSQAKKRRTCGAPACVKEIRLRANTANSKIAVALRAQARQTVQQENP